MVWPLRLLTLGPLSITGNVKVGPTPGHGTSSLLPIFQSCELEWRDLSDVEGSTVRYYANNSEYDVFEGLDLLPEKPDAFFHDSPYRRGFANADPEAVSARVGSADSRLKSGFCATATGSGTWHLQRVGPFVSVGGYDWWQMGWDDVAYLRAAKQAAPPGHDLVIDAHWTGPVDGGGVVVHHPPLHLHHVHLVPGSGDFRFFFPQATCDLFYAGCMSNKRLAQIHGDRVFPTGEGGYEGYGEDYEGDVKVPANRRPAVLRVPNCIKRR